MLWAMPHKFNAEHRGKFPKRNFRVTNWPEYNEALRGCGGLTACFEAGASEKWRARRRKTRGGHARYSDFAIETRLTLGLILKHSALNLNHLSLPEIKDFNAIGDKRCFREKAGSYRAEHSVNTLFPSMGDPVYPAWL